ncbi:hypothetical protein OCC_13965 [Thermococcus litoralis DSM 5473]|uniref:Uncharacterized protein n=1 Tax=Thermococcus litoralis (strain ATCC 51850 / DSM 5473 / JCM 8560 / NS-C) TaxID=523849 RepID=S5Z4S9_THELN|nr:hypothetical protein OCC_13965 [Thermococcus litoralis DSM 5473]
MEKRSNIIEKLEAFSEKEILSYAIASERELEQALPGIIAVS